MLNSNMKQQPNCFIIQRIITDKKLNNTLFDNDIQLQLFLRNIVLLLVVVKFYMLCEIDDDLNRL